VTACYSEPIDLHRTTCVAAMHYQLPEDRALEYAFNLRLSDFPRDDDPRPRPALRAMPDRYLHPQPTSPSLQSEATPGDGGQGDWRPCLVHRGRPRVRGAEDRPFDRLTLPARLSRVRCWELPSLTVPEDRETACH
jgi:hypothetical protein